MSRPTTTGNRARSTQPSGEGAAPARTWRAGKAPGWKPANARASDAISKVRQIDPNWRPRGESVYGTDIENQIRRANDLADEAEARIRELTSEPPPLIPKREPATSKERNDIAREIAKWLLRNYGRVVEGASWLRDHEAEINAYLDPP